MNSDKLGLKKEFLNLYLHAVLAHFTAIVVFIGFVAQRFEMQSAPN
ncbi:hypothetical protein [Acinetobacter baumannii]|nr:hypothetical protein [Acinetobacter baumannii]